MVVPQNCKFEIDVSATADFAERFIDPVADCCIVLEQDFDDDWTYTSKFSYIHARLISPAAKDFPKLIKQAFDGLEDGGWLEM